MIKTFCDCCGSELIGTNDPTLLSNLKITSRGHLYKMTVSIGNVREDGNRSYGDADPEHVCFGCVADAVARADKREKVMEDPKSRFTLHQVEEIAAAHGCALRKVSSIP